MCPCFNLLSAINGYVFESSPTLGFCNGEVATWHVSSVGAQDYIQTATFYGHTFQLNERAEDFLSLYPMTGETISMNMDNIGQSELKAASHIALTFTFIDFFFFLGGWMKPGIWLLASLNSHGTTKGMRLKFQDVKCYRDNQYEYSEYENDYDSLANKEFNVWNPLSLETIKKNEKKPVLVEKTNGEIDAYTEMFANELGLRTLKQQSNTSDVDLLDLSFLDYEVVDVINETRPHFTKTKSKSFTAAINGLNDNSLSTRLGGQNLTGVDFLNQLISKNATALQNSSASAMVNPFTSKSENDAALLLKNSSVTANLSTVHAVNNEPDKISSLKQPSYETVVSSIPPLSNNEIVTNSSDEPSDSESSEEVLIFVKGKNAGVIKTTSVKTSGHNWTYDGTHQIVPVEIPGEMKKYVEQTNKKKRTKKVTLPHRPQKGQGMKTKRRKEYKPQPRSGLPFSPRGFNPVMSPRGARPQGLQPVNDEENLINMPVVIGVPRPDFSDYELYLPGDDPDHLGLDDQNVKANEYEYVSYKDPYSSDEDAKNFHLDQANKYLENPDRDVRTYFIAAEEVQWDYAGYGQR